MAKVHIRWCDLCGSDFKSLSPFAKCCPKCKKSRFRKPGPMEGKELAEITMSPIKLLRMAAKR